MKLSPRQEAAAAAPKGGIFVSAGAGSGKTRMLTERFVRLVRQHAAGGGGNPLSSVAAITFTDKAAGELVERIRGTFAACGDLEYARHTDEAWVGTIHGLCARILRRHAFEAGLDPRFAVADEVDAGVLRQEAFEQAVREMAGDEWLQKLIVHYGVAELAECARDVQEGLRSLGADVRVLDLEDVDMTTALDTARIELENTLVEMRALEGPKATEHKNMAAVQELLAALARVDAGAEEVGVLVLDALLHFKQSRSCRACAKPLADRATVAAAHLRQSAADHAAIPYAHTFLGVLERYASFYGAMKDERGILDFEDLLIKTRELLEASPEIRHLYYERLGEIMVDEFQDTNGLQVSVVEALAEGGLTTVGDDKQSIYGWRNADVEVFRRREAAVAPERHFELDENYRSHPELVAFFNRVFSADPFWPGAFMELEAATREVGVAESTEPEWPPTTPRVRVTLLDKAACAGQGTAVAEASAVADYFAGLTRVGFGQQDLVLLLRAMTHVDAFEAALRAKGFDVFVASGGKYFDTPEAEELEALLRVIANSADDEAFARLLVGRMAALSDDSLLLLRLSAGGRSLWEAATDAGRQVMPGEDEAALRRVVDVVSSVRERQGVLPLYDLIHEACEQLDYDIAIFAGGTPRAWANTLKFARLASHFEEASAGDPSTFLDYLGLRREHSRHEQQAATAADGVDAVRIMTVHGAKGLEFPVVAVAGLGARPHNSASVFALGSPEGVSRLGVRLPDVEPFDKEARDTTTFAAIREWRRQRELDEAKRVFYVACTRASQGLALFGVADLRNEPGEAVPVDWIRTFLQTGVASGVPGLIDLGSARVEVVRKEDVGDETAGNQVAVRVPTSQDADPVQVPCPPHVPVSGEVPGTDATVPRRISYTGLSRYRACGLRYFATHVARIGGLAESTPSGQALAVGTAVHQALRLCGPHGSPSPKRIAAIARHAGLDAAGSARVQQAVMAFQDSDLAKRVFEAERVSHEVPFGVALGKTILDGSIDLVAREGAHAILVDYKTGFQEPTHDTLKHWHLQAACYALAVLRGGAESVEVVFVQPEAGAATHSIEYRTDDISGIEAEVSGIIEEISSGVFKPLERYDPAACNECPAAGVLCAVTKPL